MGSTIRGGDWVLLRVGAGTRPGRRGTCSLLRQRKVPKRKATRSLGPFGHPAVLTSSGVPLKLASLRQSRSLVHLKLRSSAQPQRVFEVRRAFAALGDQRRARCARHAVVCGFATYFVATCARPSCAKCQFHSKNKAWRAAPALGGRAQQRPVGSPNPLRLGRGAQGAAGCRAPRGRRGLSERSEFRSRLQTPSTAGCPKRSAGTQTSGRLLLLTFLGEARKVSALPGAHPGFRPQQEARK